MLQPHLYFELITIKIIIKLIVIMFIKVNSHI